MSTRKAKDDSIFHQNRYASSPEFERGLLANLVAKRCSILAVAPDRELIWYIHYLSHQAGSLAAVASDLMSKYADRLGTATMIKYASRKTQNFNLAEVTEIRQEIPRELRSKFPLRGETSREIRAISDSKQSLRNSNQAEIYRRLQQMADDSLANLRDDNSYRDQIMDEQEREKAGKHPVAYPAVRFHELCRQAAQNGDENQKQFYSLEKELCRLCLDPAYDLSAGGPWYFCELVKVLREHHQRWIKDKSSVVVTALGKKVCDTLDYTLHSRSLSLLEGNARMGKSFSAQAWCLQHPGKARFIEVPVSNDDATFFRALARGLGLGNFLKYKVAEIRERVESVLLSGDLLLVLDEAQRLWPQRNLRYGFPSRVIWVMTMANAGVPICMISTPQFIAAQKAVEKNGWNSAQLTGRIGHYEFLPTELAASDLMAVGRASLPEASEDVLKALAFYARASARYLAAVDSIAKRAKYIAQRDGRTSCTSNDVRMAMKESVVPSDTMLLRTLDTAKRGTGRGSKLPAPVLPVAPVRSVPIEAGPMSFARRTTNAEELVQG